MAADQAAKSKGVGPKMARTSDVLCCCQQWVAPRSDSRFLQCLQRLVGHVFLGSMIAAAAVVLYRRDKLFDWHKFHAGQGRKPYKTFKITPIETSCASVTDADGSEASGRDIVDVWFDGGTVSVTSTVSSTYGLAGLTEDEFDDNHCDDDQLRVMSNPFKLPDRRRSDECRDGSIGSVVGNGAACAAGLYGHVVNGTVIDVRPSPEGYFSPFGFTCIVRCPKGGYCPQSTPKNNKTDAKKCEYPKNVDKTALAVSVLNASGVEVQRLCPGARFLYLCPGGYRCKFSESLVDCDKGFRCPRGSASQQRCAGASSITSPETSCPSKNTEFPDTTIPLAVFLSCTLGIAALLLAFGGSLGKAWEVVDAYLCMDGRRHTTRGKSRLGAMRRIGEVASIIIVAERGLHQRVVQAVLARPDRDIRASSLRRLSPEHAVLGSLEDAETKRFSGCTAPNVSRCAIYGSILLFAWYAVAVATTEFVFFIPVVLASVIMLVGFFGLCTLDTTADVAAYNDDIRDKLLERDDYDDYSGDVRISYGDIFSEGEAPIVLTAYGCSRRANLATGACALLFFVVLLPAVVERGLFNWRSIVLLCLLLVATFAVVGFATLRLTRPWSDGVVTYDDFRARIKRGRMVATPTPVDDGTEDQQDDEEEGEQERKEGREAPRRISMRRSNVSRLTNKVVDLRIDLQYRNLCVRLRRGGTMVLNGASGRILSGNVTALLGPSGAGKSTLMNALSDRAAGYADVLGERYVNGRRVTGLKHLSRYTSIVPQDDIMLPQLTVRQTLSFYAAIRASHPLSRIEVEERVDEAMTVVGLPSSVWDSVIGDAERRGISGGQKKRVSYVP